MQQQDHLQWPWPWTSYKTPLYNFVILIVNFYEYNLFGEKKTIGPGKQLEAQTKKAFEIKDHFLQSNIRF